MYSLKVGSSQTMPELRLAPEYLKPSIEPAGRPAITLRVGAALLHFGREVEALARKRLRRNQRLRGGSAGFARAAIDIGDVGCDLGGPMGGLLNVAGNFLGRGTLLLDGGRDCPCDLCDPRD